MIKSDPATNLAHIPRGDELSSAWSGSGGSPPDGGSPPAGCSATGGTGVLAGGPADRPAAAGRRDARATAWRAAWRRARRFSPEAPPSQPRGQPRGPRGPGCPPRPCPRPRGRARMRAGRKLRRAGRARVRSRRGRPARAPPPFLPAQRRRRGARWGLGRAVAFAGPAIGVGRRAGLLLVRLVRSVRALSPVHGGQLPAPVGRGVGGQGVRELVDEADDGAAIGRKRRNRDPFVRAVMAVAHGAELNRRDAGPQERDRVRGAVPADDASRLAGAVLRGRRLESPHVDGLRVDQRGRTREGRDHAGTGQPADLVEDRRRVLLRQIADVHIDEAGVWDLVQGVAAENPAEIDRRPVE